MEVSYSSVVSDTLVPLHARRLAALNAAEAEHSSWAALALQLSACAASCTIKRADTDLGDSPVSPPHLIYADVGGGICLPASAPVLSMENGQALALDIGAGVFLAMPLAEARAHADSRVKELLAAREAARNELAAVAADLATARVILTALEDKSRK